ncbi:hypothetical protein LINGRAHAP2_LOCUS516 [Linum grandiflorum]
MCGGYVPYQAENEHSGNQACFTECVGTRTWRRGRRIRRRPVPISL